MNAPSHLPHKIIKIHPFPPCYPCPCSARLVCDCPRCSEHVRTSPNWQAQSWRPASTPEAYGRAGANNKHIRHWTTIALRRGRLRQKGIKVTPLKRIFLSGWIASRLEKRNYHWKISTLWALVIIQSIQSPTEKKKAYGISIIHHVDGKAAALQTWQPVQHRQQAFTAATHTAGSWRVWFCVQTAIYGSPLEIRSNTKKKNSLSCLHISSEPYPKADLEYTSKFTPKLEKKKTLHGNY